MNSEFVRNNIDLLVLLPILLILIAEARSYPGTSETYMLIILVPGIFFVILELAINALPDRYTEEFRYLIGGYASEMELEIEESEAEVSGAVKTIHHRLVVFVSLLLGFFFLAYLTGFLYAIPFFVFAVVYLLGTQDLKTAITVSSLLMVAVYFLFGELMNVPIF